MKFKALAVVAALFLSAPLQATSVAEETADMIWQKVERTYASEGGFRSKDEIASQLFVEYTVSKMQQQVSVASRTVTSRGDSRDVARGAEQVADAIEEQMRSSDYYHLRVYFAEAVLWAALANREAGNRGRALELFKKGLPVAMSLTHDSQVRERYQRLLKKDW